MSRADVLDRYKEVLYNIEGIKEKDVPAYAKELTIRHQPGWAIPASTYRRCKDLLHYKDSLKRNSPYYVDLLRIEDRNNLKVVLLDIYHVMNFKS